MNADRAVEEETASSSSNPLFCARAHVLFLLSLFADEVEFCKGTCLFRHLAPRRGRFPGRFSSDATRARGSHDSRDGTMDG
jgi:hypothetical protein